MLTCAINQVSGDEELLDIARDCFRFVTTFFEPINVSAVHIYHSALELSPLSSIVRRLYYHRRHTPFPRAMAGTQNLWDHSSTVRHRSDHGDIPFTWSPCGQLVVANYRGVMEIRDPVTSELLSTLRPTKLVCQPIRSLAYSPDGRSLAALSATSFIIWDIHTGGVAKEIECGAAKIPLVWSLDGQAIGTLLLDKPSCFDYTVRVYDVDSGVAQFHGTLRSSVNPHLWAHNESFRITTTEWGNLHYCDAIVISEIGSALTEIESFCDGPPRIMRIESFSPTTYRIAALVQGHLHIFDIRNWECLLEQWDEPNSSHRFSPDGSLFATSSESSIRVWKYTSSHYTLWGKFSTQSVSPSLQFSPDLSSIIGWFPDLLRVWRLDRPPVAHPDGPDLLTCVLSQCGTYVATSHFGGSTVTITNLLLQSPSQFIDTGIESIWGLALTGNVLLVMGASWGEIAAWRLREGGVVNGLPGGRRAGRGDSIWVIPPLVGSTFLIRGQTVVMEWGGVAAHVYHTRTGEVLELTQPPPHPRDRKYSLLDMMYGLHYLHRRSLEVPSTHSENDWPVSRTTLEEEGWVKDPEGRHRLWIPPAWRICTGNAGWHYNMTALWFTARAGTVIVKF